MSRYRAFRNHRGLRGGVILCRICDAPLLECVSRRQTRIKQSRADQGAVVWILIWETSLKYTNRVSRMMTRCLFNRGMRFLWTTGQLQASSGNCADMKVCVGLSSGIDCPPDGTLMIALDC